MKMHRGTVHPLTETPSGKIEHKSKLFAKISPIIQVAAGHVRFQHLNALRGKLQKQGEPFGGSIIGLTVRHVFLVSKKRFFTRETADLTQAPGTCEQLSANDVGTITAPLCTGTAIASKVKTRAVMSHWAGLKAYPRASLKHRVNARTPHKAPLLSGDGVTAKTNEHILRPSELWSALAADSAIIESQNKVQTGCSAVGSSAPVQVIPVENTVAATNPARSATVKATGVNINNAGCVGHSTRMTLAYSVKFLNYDWALLHDVLVKSGEDCPDPVAQGEIEAPTRPSDRQWHYISFAGWSTTPNGDVDETVLQDVSKSLTLFPAFVKELRYYTIRFYDGENLLHTMSVAYGDTPSYTPTKTGAVFDGWYPSVAPVVGDADYYAQWKEVPTFAAASWETIAEISASGEASNYFAIGDTKDVTLTDGTKMTFEIIGFNHDDLADGSGKAGITVLSKYVDLDGYCLHNVANGRNIHWSACQLRTYLNSGKIYSLIPDEIKSVAKTVRKTQSQCGNRVTTLQTTSDKFWIPSITEVGFTGSMSYVASGQGARYEIFNASSSSSKLDPKLLKTNRSGTVKTYWLRSPRNSGSYASYFTILQNGSYAYAYQNNSWNYTGVVFGFCI